MLEQIERRVPSPPRTIDETISPALEEVCVKAMAKNPADRYTTAADLATALHAAIAAPAQPATAKWPRWVALSLVVAGSRCCSQRQAGLGRRPKPTDRASPLNGQTHRSTLTSPMFTSSGSVPKGRGVSI